MTNENIFEIAVREKLRFPYKGMISTEDLFDLSVKDLDSIFKILNAKVKTVNEESLLSIKTSEDKTLTTMIEIIKYIVNIKLAEENIRLEEIKKKEQKQKIMKILAWKQDADLQTKSVDDLKAMLDELES